MIFRSQYGDGKVVVCNVVIPKYNEHTNMYEMWISYDGREDTYIKIAEYNKIEIIGFLIVEATNRNIIFDLEINSDFSKSLKIGCQNLGNYIKEKY
jgi:hypothetical protein